MPTPLIAFPFRLTQSGAVVTQHDDSDEYLAAELAVLALTHIGERELVPDYGITDPTFSAFDDVEFVEQAALFVPVVKVNAISAEWVSDTQQAVQVDFDSVDEFVDAGFTDTGQVTEFSLEAE